MTPKENLLRVLRFDHPECVPTGIPAYCLSYVGAGHGARWQWRRWLARRLALARHLGRGLARKGCRTSWGCPSLPARRSAPGGHLPLPDPLDPRICGRIHADPMEFDREQLFLGGAHRDTLFEQAYMLVGMENLMVAFYDQPVAVKALLHRIIDFHLGLARQPAKGVEWAFVGDDLGHQSGLLFCRAILEEFFVHEYRRLFSFYRSTACASASTPVGACRRSSTSSSTWASTMLNPVQATANDLLVRAHAGQMTLQGAIPSHVVQEGPVERIRAEVRRRSRCWGATAAIFAPPIRPAVPGGAPEAFSRRPCRSSAATRSP